jgi:hypothetical protein
VTAAKDCRIQIFHSLCVWMLRVEARDLGLPTDFVVYDEQDSIDLLQHCPGGGDSSTYAQLSQLKSDCKPDDLTLAVIPTLNTRFFRFVPPELPRLSRAERPQFLRPPLSHPCNACLPPGKARQVGYPFPLDPDGRGSGHPHRQISEMLENGNYGRIAVPTRTHRRAQVISKSLERSRIPHLTVQQFDFFRRTEIKNVLARLRLLFNPADSGSLERMIQRPVSGIVPATLRTLREDGQQCGLRLTDLAQLRSLRDGDPFHILLHALARGTVVVFNVETTGLSPVDDEVIDFGAVELVAGHPQPSLMSSPPRNASHEQTCEACDSKIYCPD